MWDKLRKYGITRDNLTGGLLGLATADTLDVYQRFNCKLCS